MTTRPARIGVALLALAGLVAGCTTSPASSPGAESTGASTAAAASESSTPPASSGAESSAPPAVSPSPTGSASPTTSPAGSPEPSPASSAPSTAPPSSPPSPEASASPSTAKPTPTRTPATPYVAPDRPAPTGWSPFDGRRANPDPVLIVKLDNTTYAQPHAGLTRADLVYIEEVEYGITRLAAVFSSNIPRRIGPVRSARITDIDLLAQYDRPAFGFSGAQRRLLPALKAAPFYDVSPYTGGSGYSRDNSRRAPYNLYVNGQTALDRAPKASRAHDIGFVFGSSLPTGGLVAKTADMAWGYGKAGFDYDAKSGLYDITLNGKEARSEESSDGQRAATVVIQSVRQTPSAYFDKGGGNTPHAETIGSGTALVLRDGQVWRTRWSRPTRQDGTTFTLADGSVMTFKPGQLWIVLLDKKRKAIVKPLTRPRTILASPSASASASVAASQEPLASSMDVSSASPAAQ